MMIEALFDVHVILNIIHVLSSPLRAFDVELLYIAQCFKIPIAEVAVNWTEIEGWCVVKYVMHCTWVCLLLFKWLLFK